MSLGKLAKVVLSRGALYSGASRLGLAAQRRLSMPYVRALNYHDTPETEAHVLDAQLRYYARHFEPVGLAELRAFADGDWPHARPGLLISFDDGLASHAQVAAPILERHGFTGWFNVPTGFVDTPVAEQVAYARAHQINVRSDAKPGDRVAMSWDELRALQHRHVICSHTVDHVRFEHDLETSQLEHELVVSRARLEEELGTEVVGFAWVGGEESSYSAPAAEMIRKVGFEVVLTTNNDRLRPGDGLMSIERVNVETFYDHALTAFHLSGFYDVFYAGKRRRVQALTGMHRADARARSGRAD